MSLQDAVANALSPHLSRLKTVTVSALDPVADRPTVGEALRTSGRVSSLFVGLGGVAWVSGAPFLFPSLGPSAYALAVSPSAATSQPQRVLGGHLFGVLGGLLAYHLLAPGLAVTSLPPALTVDGARLAGSALLSLGLTSTAMLATDLRHAPACATTLIVSLGILTSLREAGIILVAILALVILDYALPGFEGVDAPPRG